MEHHHGDDFAHPAGTGPDLTASQSSSSRASNGFVSGVKAFSFVQVTETDLKHKSSTQKAKRYVRSHVMRDYHRNKRLSSTIEYKRLQDLEMGRSRGSATSLAGTDDPTILRQNSLMQPSYALPYLDNLVPYSYFAPSGPVLYLKPSSWPFPRPFAMSSWPFPRQTVTSGTDQTDRFGSSVFPRQSIWMPNAFIPDGVVIKGPLLGGDVLSWISHTPECFKYRVEIIKWVQDQLKNTETATSDATIGAIMTLTMWENGDGSSLDLTNHMNGLQRIVSLKGGLTNLCLSRGMTAKIILFDYILAVTCAQDPRFGPFPYPQPELAPTNTSRDGTFVGSPLYGDGSFRDLKCDHNQNEIVYLLQMMWSLTIRGLEAGPNNIEVQQEGLVDSSPTRPAQYKIHDESPRSPLLEDSSQFHILGVLHHTALIYQRAIFHPRIPFKSNVNHPDLKSLYKALNISAPDSFWLDYPGVLLWVLLVACAVAVDREERSYFMMFLAKVGIFTEPKCWFESQTAILRFIEVQRLSRRHGG